MSCFRGTLPYSVFIRQNWKRKRLVSQVLLLLDTRASTCGALLESFVAARAQVDMAVSHLRTTVAFHKSSGSFRTRKA